MLFNSVDFAIFLIIVFILYWFVVNKNLKLQNWFIVLASYIFYGWWDWRFLSLIFFSTILDYSIGVKLKNENVVFKRKIILWISIIVNLGVLCVFKYFNFFLDSLYALVPALSNTFGFNSLDIILPVGISFYTFQTLSYTIDVYKRKLEPTTDLIAFSAFVSFFPQLVAGPIERATNLLPQFYKQRTFNYLAAVDGMRQILWGLFKKIVIADNCAEYANQIFNNSSDMNGSTLVLGAFFFTFQIYGDFSGYSDIAIGTSRLFGFNLMKNFSFPYFSRDIAEFWRRWHISLSTWFRDYLYIPLGGSNGGTFMKVSNTFIIFIVSGFWHGANWTFIAWGALNALYFLPLLLTNKNRNNIEIVAKGKYFPSFKDLLLIISTFGLTVFAWIFFRAQDIGHALQYISGIFSSSIFDYPKFSNMIGAIYTLLYLIFFIVIEWIGRNENYAIEKLALNSKRFIRYGFYYLIIIIIIYASLGKSEQTFIYFQF